MTTLEDLDHYASVAQDEMQFNMCDDGESYEDFTIEVSAKWVLEMQDHMKNRLKWAQKDAAKLEKLQPLAHAVLEATAIYKS